MKLRCKSKRRVRPRGVFAASDKSLPRSRKTPFDLGCSRDTSRGCVGRRCTVLSYTFRSHPYQNAVECGWCSKVFFGLRNNDAGPSCEPAIHPEGKVASQDNNSREARNTYSEGAAYFGGTSPLTATNVATPGGLPAFPYFAAAKYTARPAH